MYLLCCSAYLALFVPLFHRGAHVCTPPTREHTQTPILQHRHTNTHPTRTDAQTETLTRVPNKKKINIRYKLLNTELDLLPFTIFSLLIFHHNNNNDHGFSSQPFCRRFLVDKHISRIPSLKKYPKISTYTDIQPNNLAKKNQRLEKKVRNDNEINERTRRAF